MFKFPFFFLNPLRTSRSSCFKSRDWKFIVVVRLILSSAVSKIKKKFNLFVSCGILPAGLIEQRDSQPLLKLIESIGDWPVASDDWNSTTGRNTL